MLASNKRGLTLTELIVSTILIGIVMMGVASFNYAMKSVQDSTGNSALLAMKSQSAMHEIVKAAQTAVGYNPIRGIVCRPKLGNPDACNGTVGISDRPYFSFLQDRNNDGDGDDNGTDEWVIFTSGDTAGNFRNLYVCTQNIGTGAEPNGVCTVNASSRLLLSNISDITYDFDPAAGLYFTISITTRLDASKNKDPLTNPEHTLQTRIIPTNHSW